jgi:transcriptional regulator with GAF, ATPase, and Fis domain
MILRDVNDRLEAEREIDSLRKQTQSLREKLRAFEGDRELLGNAPSVKAMLADIRQVAVTDATVLIQGETGTGKELVARAIHANSLRKNRAFIKLNCGAIPEGLIESELFGHEKGAFTGATAKREGRFLQANHGTLFLDEIGDLPLDLQVKLLRVLQEGEFESVGGSKTIKVDVRVIAATNKILIQEVNEERFREDLFYRLNVFPIQVPPLRDRKEDIPTLAQAFTERIASRIGKKIIGPLPEDLKRLGENEWPGNIRELENVIERAVITSSDGRLNLQRALPAHSIGVAANVEDNSPFPGRVKTSAEMEALERENLLHALEETNWKISGKGGAAELLDISPSTLNYRLKTLGIKRSSE